MKILETVSAAKELRQAWRMESVGFVPTMGALHEGHLTLMRKALSENTRVLVSIFVNPLQFNSASDLENYPRPIKSDLAMLRDLGVHAVLVPSKGQMYGADEHFKISENFLSQVLCGPTRPGHFDGMLTVVMKLLQIAGARRAYFGEKDYQQLKLIQAMAEAFFLDTEIVGCPTVRESDGLAMSSRNLLLNEIERALAPALYKALTTSSGPEEAKATLSALGFKVDYIEERWGRRFAAAFLGPVRLIDNVEI